MFVDYQRLSASHLGRKGFLRPLGSHGLFEERKINICRKISFSWLVKDVNYLVALESLKYELSVENWVHKVAHTLNEFPNALSSP